MTEVGNFRFEKDTLFCFEEKFVFPAKLKDFLDYRDMKFFRREYSPWVFSCSDSKIVDKCSSVSSSYLDYKD